MVSRIRSAVRYTEVAAGIASWTSTVSPATAAVAATTAARARGPKPNGGRFPTRASGPGSRRGLGPW